MTKSTPPSDWIAYLVVALTVGGMLLGKYLIARGVTPTRTTDENQSTEEKREQK